VRGKTNRTCFGGVAQVRRLGGTKTVLDAGQAHAYVALAVFEERVHVSGKFVEAMIHVLPQIGQAAVVHEDADQHGQGRQAHSQDLGSHCLIILDSDKTPRMWQPSPCYFGYMPLENPFEDPLRFERRVPECALVIFGANGDLTKRKLLPALYRLAYDRRLAAGFAVLGVSRTPMTDDEFRQKMCAAVKEFREDSPFDEDVWNAFAQGLFYMAGDIYDAAMYTAMDARLKEIEAARHTGGNALFYLSTQPSQYIPIAQGLGAANLGKGSGWRRIVVEKPFGHDLASARELSDQLHNAFAEPEVYRIDHYLGKETVQNILAFRFGNGIFEPLWNRRYVNHVQITAAESIGVEGRGAYYQEAGSLRDMIQNHLVQVLATVAMEPSATFRATSVRDERSKLLRSIRVMTPEEVMQNTVPGQYGPARIGGEDVPGFRQETGVKPDAQTDTYAAVTFLVDNWRWAGVPFYLRSGKRLPKRVTEIAIQFNEAPLTIFEGNQDNTVPNLLILRIQPEEGISLKFLSKRPGAGMKLRPVSMDFNYGSSFGERSPSAYETLLLDAMLGDATLYTRQDMVEASWAVVDAIQHVWDDRKFDFPNYAAGTWGPAAADAMLARRGHVWRKP
jgi:glucose-6-phosphate 1-dehydrogenase